MGMKRHKPEEIVMKLRQVEVLDHFVQQLDPCRSNLCCVTNEWQQSPPRRSINHHARAANFVLHALAAKIREFSYGLKTGFGTAKAQEQMAQMQ